MNGSEKLQLIDKFLHGNLSEEDFADFLDRLGHDSTFREEVGRRTSLEADLFCLQYAVASKEDEKILVEQLSCGELAPRSDELAAGENEFTDEEWGLMIEAGISESVALKKLTPWHRYGKYLIAACFVGMAVASYSARDFLFDTAGTLVKKVRGVQTEQMAVLSADSVVSFENSTVLIEQNSVASVDSVQDDCAEVTLSRGSAVMHVEQGKKKSLSIKTPQVRVTSKGALASVKSEQGITIIDVDSGSVEFSHAGKKESSILTAPASVVAGSDTIISLLPRAMHNAKSRKLLEEFLSRTANDIPGIGNSADALPVIRTEQEEHLISLFRKEIDLEQLGAQLRSLPESAFTYEAVSQALSLLVSNHKNTSLHACDTLSAIIKKSSIRQLILYRSAEVMKMQKALGAAVDRYMKAFRLSSTGPLAEESLIQILKIADSSFADMQSVAAGLYMEHFYQSPRAESVLFSYANNLRIAGSLDKAMAMYEQYAALYPQGRYKDDAVYWIGWCLVQGKLEHGNLDKQKGKQLLRPDGHVY